MAVVPAALAFEVQVLRGGQGASVDGKPVGHVRGHCAAVIEKHEEIALGFVHLEVSGAGDLRSEHKAQTRDIGHDLNAVDIQYRRRNEIIRLARRSGVNPDQVPGSLFQGSVDGVAGKFQRRGIKEAVGSKAALKGVVPGTASKGIVTVIAINLKCRAGTAEIRDGCEVVVKVRTENLDSAVGVMDVEDGRGGRRRAVGNRELEAVVFEDANGLPGG